MRGSGRSTCAAGAVRAAAFRSVPTLAIVLTPAAANAQADAPLTERIPEIAGRVFEVTRLAFSREETAVLTLVLGIIAFAVTVSIMLVRTRQRLRDTRALASETVAELAARADRAEGLLGADQQVLVVWGDEGDAPEVRCEPGSSRDLPARRGDVLAFGKWLEPGAAADVERRVERLRNRGESFNVMLKTRSGGHVEADGRTAGPRAVLRLRDLAGQRRELAEIYHRHKQLLGEVNSMRRLLATVPMPAWMRGADGKLTWANQAFARHADNGDAARAVSRGTELFDADTLRMLADRRMAGETVSEQLSVTLGGERRALNIFEARASDGSSAGIAVDVTDGERAKRELQRRETAHVRTLDMVTAGIAVFDTAGRLVFHNAAFRTVWPLEDEFLLAFPSHREILDRLRVARRLPEQADYRAWRERQVAPFPAPSSRRDAGAQAPVQELWHLPDGQILRTARSPHSDGGIAWLVEDVTETLDLESQFVALTRVQRETLDSLDEGIAVFGSDGRLKLYNPSFAAIWKLSATSLDGEPHVEQVIGWCRALHAGDDVWRHLKESVTGLADGRHGTEARFVRPDDSVIDLRAVPLPDGATLTVFTNVSDTARIEKALRDRNEALVAAARIKTEFVHKVSYELRAPLTNIIGFAQLMSDKSTGPLNERQLEYTGHILNSSGALLAIINDILDLATVDAGVMELEVGQVDIAATVEAATDAMRDRFSEAQVTLALDIEEKAGSFLADEKRIRQILFNLLSNAVGFSDPGQTVRLACRRDFGNVVFTVADEGRGIPEDVRRAVFERFESHAHGTRHRGAGLGLSIVKSFVELHGGEVKLYSEPGHGTTLTCVFPPRPSPQRQAADNLEGPVEGPQRAGETARRSASGRSRPNVS